MRQPLFEHRMELAGYETRALELLGDGPPLLLVHGLMDSADTWRSTLAHLSRAGRAALAVDLPGFGAAARLQRDEPVLPQEDAFVAAAIEHLAEQHGRDVVLVGNSLGGCLVLRAAQDDALPVAAVVPVAPAGFDVAVWFNVLEGDAIVRLLLAGLIPHRVVRTLVGQGYRQLAFARPRAVEPGVVNAFVEHLSSQRDVRRAFATGRRLLPEIRDPFDLARIRAPVLLVWGDRDRMVSHRGSRHLVEAIPDLQYELLPDCGHCPQIEHPARLTTLIETFIRDRVTDAAPARRRAGGGAG